MAMKARPILFNGDMTPLDYLRTKTPHEPDCACSGPWYPLEPPCNCPRAEALEALDGVVAFAQAFDALDVIVDEEHYPPFFVLTHDQWERLLSARRALTELEGE